MYLLSVLEHLAYGGAGAILLLLIIRWADGRWMTNAQSGVPYWRPQ